MNNDNNKTVIANVNSNNEDKMNINININNNTVINSNTLYTVKEFKAILNSSFEGNKTLLLNHLIKSGTTMRVKVSPTNSLNALSSSDPKFSHYVIPVIQRGGLRKSLRKHTGKKLKILRRRGTHRRTHH